MAGIGQRIKEAADKLGGLNQLSEATGIPRRTLGDYVSGATEPKASALESIAKATDSDLNWLLRNDYPVGLGGAAPGFVSSQVLVPRYDIQASAGSGRLITSSDVHGHLSVGRDWLRRNLPPWAPSNAVVGVLEGSGDSMEPTIRDGDLIMVVQGVDLRVVERGGVFVFSMDHDRLLLKRLQLMLNGDLSIISDNPAYATEVIPGADLAQRILIHGLVFFVGGKPRSVR
jgi:phage repressor protein C with HTH and peptisase S24 domain